MPDPFLMIPPVVNAELPAKVSVEVLLETSIVVFVPAVSVKTRFVEPLPPVKRSVASPNASALPLPMSLLVPPLDTDPMLSVPLFTVVVPL